ncbi:MAG: hypothetical protein WD872_17155 [Pirellulaceae bacterium]
MKTDYLWLTAALCGCWLAGCGSSPVGPAAGEGQAAADYKHRPADDLPAIGDYLPPLDLDRVEVAGPQDWTPLRRSSKYLTGFVHGKTSELPRISVHAADAPQAATADTTIGNAADLAALLDKQLQSDASKQVPEGCYPIVLGETPFVRHVRLAKMGGNPVVIQSLQTVQEGRLYTIELICDVNASDRREYRASLTEFRDQAYAVAANMRFGASEAAEEVAPAKEVADDAAEPVAPVEDKPIPE